MSETIITKRCSACKDYKPLTEFYKYSSYKDGHIARCKICTIQCSTDYHKTEKGKKICKKALKRWRQTENGKIVQRRSDKRYQKSKKGKQTQKKANKKYRKSNPAIIKAHNAVLRAVLAGKLPKVKTLMCSCGNQAKGYHHHLGYEPKHWFDVIAVCCFCHRRIHRNSLLAG